MIQDFLGWLHLLNQNDPVAQARNASNIIFLVYIVTFKRSWLFFMAFLFCNLLTDSNFLGVFDDLPMPLYGLSFYVTICFVWCVTVKSHINHTRNKSLALSCIIMISFLLLMAWDSYYNAEIETFIYSSYEVIIVCIHICIILSLYDVAAALSDLVSKFRDSWLFLRSTYTV